MDNKDFLQVYYYENKSRVGVNMDGGYVICDIDCIYDCYISCGVSNEASFDRDFLNRFSYIKKEDAYAFDGTIEDYPYQYTKNITYIKKNINTFNDDTNTNLFDLIDKYDNIFLSIDIEGCEYKWLSCLTESQLSKFKQICIEFHGVNDDTWGIPYNEKVKSFKLLNKTHYLTHAHGNNHSGITGNIPDVLELTYISKEFINNVPIKNYIPLPIKNLDFPNHPPRKDFNLHSYPFVDPDINLIFVGDSTCAIKIIKLDKVFDNKTELTFQYKNYINKNSDKFTYKFKNDKLIITRVDKNTGWAQQLVAYIK